MIRPRQPLSRWVAAGVALGITGYLAGVVALAVLLLRPEPQRQPNRDPRVAITCVEPEETPPDDVPLVTSNDVYACPAMWDGQRVRYRGEVVGAVLRRGDQAWVQLNDDVHSGGSAASEVYPDYPGGNAGVGVVVPAGLADRIRFVGGPGHRGDVVEVTGAFHRIDSTSREAAIIRADGGRILSAGAQIEMEVFADRRALAAVLVPVAAVAAVVSRRRSGA